MDKEKYEPQATKISPSMAVVWDAICQALNTDTYHLLQGFIYTMIRASNQHHELAPEIQKLMAMLQVDAGWQNAFNLCNPDGLKVARCILILEQEDKKGFGAVMVNKPWMEQSYQTESVDEIVECVLEVCMQGIFKRVRKLGAQMQSERLSDILLKMIDTQSSVELDRENAAEMRGRNDIAGNGKPYAYGKKTKSKQRRTIDGEAHRQQVISFNDEDQAIADMEEHNWGRSSVTADDIERGMGCRPFTDEA